jgi:hypothetical protein
MAAEAVAFQGALTRLGFNADSSAALNANGITSVRDLINLDSKDVEHILKIIRTGPPPVPVPYLAQKRLNIFCYWATRRDCLNETIDAARFNDAAMTQYGSMLALSEQAKDEDLIVKPPGEYKTGTKWKAFKEGAIAYLNCVKGKHDIPLAYVIRENEIPQVNHVYQSEHHHLIEVTPLVGAEFEEDNGRVFDLLKSWTVNGPAWTWMRSQNAIRNGRQAWLAIVNHFEGEAQRDRVKDNAYAAIAVARYYGERKRFTFETYVTIHQDAYSDLEQYGEIISEEKRVRDLLTNIKDLSPAANAAKGTILATPNLRNNFSNAVAHLTTALQLGQTLQQDTRNISGATTTGRGRGGQGGRGGGGRYRGRGGCGRGVRNIFLGSYSPDHWQRLSSADKKRVIEGRERSGGSTTGGRGQGSQGNHPNQGGGSQGGARQVASVAYGGGEDGNSTLGPSRATIAAVEQAIL